MDRVLQERNFAREAETAVKTCDVQTLCALPAHAHARVDFACTAAWFDAFVELNGVAATDCKKLRSILKQVSPPVAYVSLSDEGRIVSCGMGIAEGRDVGIFSLVTARNLRNRGLGQQLIGHIARWASGEGSERAYLQVMAENVPAWGAVSQIGLCRALPLLVSGGADIRC